jgi:hypothetical protein
MYNNIVISMPDLLELLKFPVVGKTRLPTSTACYAPFCRRQLDSVINLLFLFRTKKV